MKYGKVVIIPCEDEILVDSFVEDIKCEGDEKRAYKDFVDKYQPEIKMTENELKEAPTIVAGLGHLSYKSEDDIGNLTFYIPRNITSRQEKYFNQHILDFYKYPSVSAFSICDTEIKHIHGLLKIKGEISNKYKQNKEMKRNVR